jgi:predicted XRE-type DNA-binding protein
MSDYRKGSGNVFKDLGFVDAEQRLAKAKLASLINDILEERGLTQREAAEILGLSQPKISALKHGRLAGFSLERLFTLLRKLDRDIEIIVSRRPARRPSRGIHVSAA